MSTTGESETKYIFVTGGVVSALGKGIVAASLGRLLKERGLRVQAQKFDPYLNVDPGHDEPLPARRGVRHRGRRRDRSRHRPLRALHRREPLAERQPQCRCDLGCRAAEGTEGRVPRRHRPGDPAHHERDQAAHQARCEGGARRRRHLRDRRHRRRHRVAALSRGDPAVPAGGRPGERDVPPLHARPVHRGGRRAEDEADAALGERASTHRYPPGRDRLPLPRGALAGHQGQDRALRRCRHSLRHRGAGCLRRLSRPGRAARGGPRRARLHAARHRCASGRPRRVAGGDRPDRRAAGTGDDRPRRQVREAPRRVPLGARGAEARRRSPGCGGARAMGRRREHVVRGDRRAAGAGRRRPRSRRLRLARVGGEDPRLPGRARAQHPLPRNLSRHARCRVRVRAQRGRVRRGELDRDGSGDAVLP